MKVDKLEERWTSSSIHAVFSLQDLPACNTKSHTTPVHLSLLTLGWTFCLSLTPKTRKSYPTRASQWILSAASFLRNEDKFTWGSTRMHAQLFLDTEQDDATSFRGRDDSVGSVDVVLADTPSAVFSLTTSDAAPCYTFSSSQPTNVTIMVTIRDCPSPSGLFQASPGNGDEAEAQTKLIKQCGHRVLSRSITTGKLFDVKFVTSLTRSTSRSPAKRLTTYASLAVLEKSVKFPDSNLKGKLGEDWKNAFAPSKDHNITCAEQVLCPKDDEYDELDSDYEDEDDEDASDAVGLDAPFPPCEPHPVIILEEKQPEGSPTRSSSSLSFSDLEGGQWPAADVDRTVSVKFAAHRTWHAFLWYCYTGEIEFNKLKSQVEPGVRRRIRMMHVKEGSPTCSPKSMYRLADLVGNKSLKATALSAIREQMTEANVLDEMFSVFTSRYPDVLEAQLDVLKGHCSSPEVKKMFIKNIPKYSSVAHAEPILSAFYDRFLV